MLDRIKPHIVALVLFGCSGSSAESEPASSTPTAATAATTPDTPAAPVVTEAATSEEVAAVAPAPSRPAGPAPALGSVRWAPDPREPEQPLEALDAVAREHFRQPARVAGRLRARFGRERISLALVATVDERLDNDEHDVDTMIRFGRTTPQNEAEPGTGPGLERRTGGDLDDDPCRCDGDDVVELHLLRVVHGASPQVASVDLARVCSGLWFDARLMDFDGDGRVEVRLDVTYTGQASCGANTKEVTRMFVLDVADLTLQANVVLRDYDVQYEDEHLRETRARFRDLDGDGDKDIELVGTGRSIENHEESRYPIRERWLYDPAVDRWSPRWRAASTE